MMNVFAFCFVDAASKLNFLDLKFSCRQIVLLDIVFLVLTEGTSRDVVQRNEGVFDEV
jgi:hypothetical protein